MNIFQYFVVYKFPRTCGFTFIFHLKALKVSLLFSISLFSYACIEAWSLLGDTKPIKTKIEHINSICKEIESKYGKFNEEEDLHRE